MNAALLFVLLAVTHPHPSQIRNANQVRVCNEPPDCVDARPGTHVDRRQLQDGRFVDPAPQAFIGTGDQGKRTVCLQTFLGINLNAGGYVSACAVCFSQYGLAKLLQDPAWLAWWNAQP